MHNIITIFKKEMTRVLTDKRLILMIFIVPGLSIYVMYSLIGGMISDQMDSVSDHTIILYEENMPDTLKSQLESLSDPSLEQPIDIEFNDAALLSENEIVTKIQDGDIDIVLKFEDNFEQKIDNYTSETPPEVDVFYHYGKENSSFSYTTVKSVLESYQTSKLADRLDDSSYLTVFETDIAEDIVDEREITGQTFASLLPMLIVIFLFAGAMSIGPDSIAGEKERNTIATLLITPIKRSDIALGKVFSLGTLAFVSALSSFIGIMLSLPKLMQMGDGELDYNIYTFSDYAVILLVLISTVLVIVGLISVVSAYAKTIKEASMFIMPFYFITLIIGIVTSFGADASQLPLVHAIPIYGAVNLLNGIFTFNWTVGNFLIVCLSSLVYTGLFTFILTKMFGSEKIMFQK
ncbi:MAG: ABC transporter permease [Bacillota bacterium]